MFYYIRFITQFGVEYWVWRHKPDIQVSLEKDGAISFSDQEIPKIILQLFEHYNIASIHIE